MLTPEQRGQIKSARTVHDLCEKEGEFDDLRFQTAGAAAHFDRGNLLAIIDRLTAQPTPEPSQDATAFLDGCVCTSNPIGPLYGAGWNSCVDMLRTRLPAWLKTAQPTAVVDYKKLVDWLTIVLNPMPGPSAPSLPEYIAVQLLASNLIRKMPGREEIALIVCKHVPPTRICDQGQTCSCWAEYALPAADAIVALVEGKG